MTLAQRYLAIRKASIMLCDPLKPEDMVVQPTAFVSPIKWHLGHVTWFFETMILKRYKENYQPFNTEFDFVFNSYYEALGKRILRTDRGNLTRPTVDEVKEYRAYVDKHMVQLLEKLASSEYNETEFDKLVELGLQHEQQHQELIMMDMKYILGHNPLFPALFPTIPKVVVKHNPLYISVEEGVYEIGYAGDKFSFDNERGRHKVYLNSYHMSPTLVTNAEYMEFIDHKGYYKPEYWTMEGWQHIQREKITAPMYWHKIDSVWHDYNFDGLKLTNPNDAVMHISWYEANAFAKWKAAKYGTPYRLPTEAEWEVASPHLTWGQLWEHTSSAYLPYPGFKEFDGLAKEYNGKFMINQMVLRGACISTPASHIDRNTYRNFFHPDERWQYSGIRLVY